MRIRLWILTGVAVAGLALVLSACGGGDDDDDSGDDGGAATATLDSGDGGDEETPEATAEDEGTDEGGHDSAADAVDACSLVTKDEAEAALGAPVSDGEAQDYPPIYSCRYMTQDSYLVDVTVVVFENDDQAEEVHDQAVNLNDYEKVDGIGERAYYALGFGLTVLQDEFELSVSVAGSDDDRGREEDLAKIAVERLP